MLHEERDCLERNHCEQLEFKIGEQLNVFPLGSAFVVGTTNFCSQEKYPELARHDWLQGGKNPF